MLLIVWFTVMGARDTVYVHMEKPPKPYTSYSKFVDNLVFQLECIAAKRIVEFRPSGYKKLYMTFRRTNTPILYKSRNATEYHQIKSVFSPKNTAVFPYQDLPALNKFKESCDKISVYFENFCINYPKLRNCVHRGSGMFLILGMTTAQCQDIICEKNPHVDLGESPVNTAVLEDSFFKRAPLSKRDLQLSRYSFDRLALIDDYWWFAGMKFISLASCFRLYQHRSSVHGICDLIQLWHRGWPEKPCLRLAIKSSEGVTGFNWPREKAEHKLAKYYKQYYNGEINGAEFIDFEPSEQYNVGAASTKELLKPVRAFIKKHKNIAFNIKYFPLGFHSYKLENFTIVAGLNTGTEFIVSVYGLAPFYNGVISSLFDEATHTLTFLGLSDFIGCCSTFPQKK